MADSLGSRSMIACGHWKEMKAAGVHLASALPIGNLLLRPLRGRIDLRNHRKIVVIDNQKRIAGAKIVQTPNSGSSRSMPLGSMR
jgi:cardiolipin synthase